MTKQPPSFPDDLDAEPGDGLDRLISLSDGIYAFAMTLLAVNVDIPHLAADAGNGEITTAVLGLAPQLEIFITSFLLVALYWQISRRTFRYIVRNDAALTWLTLLQLMCVAFLPVATGLFDTYGTVTSVVLVYAGTLAIIGILGRILWQHAIRAGLLDGKLHPVYIEYFSFRSSVTIGIYLMLMVVAFLQPQYARWILFLLLIIYPFLQRIFRWWYTFRHKDVA